MDPRLSALIPQFTHHADPMLILDLQGRVVFATPHALVLLPGVLVGNPLPDPLLSALGAAGDFCPFDDTRGSSLLSLPLGAPPCGRLLHIRPLSAQSTVGELFLQDSNARLLSDIAHEFNTPLSVVLSALSLLRQGEPFTERGLSLLQTARQNTQRLIALVQSLVSLSRLYTADQKALPRKQADLSACIDSVCSAFSSCLLDPLPIHFIKPPQPLLFSFDSMLIEHCLLNLLSNACKFGGPDNVITVTLAYEGSCAHICVADKGHGIPPAQLSEIGKRFVQGINRVPLQGFGLGLSIVKSFVDLHGGSFSLESTLGQGTTARITLPDLAPVDSGEPLVLREQDEGATARRLQYAVRALMGDLSK